MKYTLQIVALALAVQAQVQAPAAAQTTPATGTAAAAQPPQKVPVDVLIDSLAQVTNQTDQTVELVKTFDAEGAVEEAPDLINSIVATGDLASKSIALMGGSTNGLNGSPTALKKLTASLGGLLGGKTTDDQKGGLNALKGLLSRRGGGILGGLLNALAPALKPQNSKTPAAPGTAGAPVPANPMGSNYTVDEQTKICAAYRQMTNKNQHLLGIMDVKSDILVKSPYADPVAAVLSNAQSNLNRLGLTVVDIAPTCAAQAASDTKELDAAMTNAIKVLTPNPSDNLDLEGVASPNWQPNDDDDDGSYF